MNSLRFECTGRWPVHFFKRIAGPAAALMRVAAAPAHAAAAPQPVAAQKAAVPAQSVEDFYRGRNGYPLWLSPNAGFAAQQLIGLLSTSAVDGLYPDKYKVADLQQALDAARKGKKKDIDRAERALSDAYVAYVSDLMLDPNTGVTYVDAALRPKPP